MVPGTSIVYTSGMRIIKNLLPVLICVTLAFYGYYTFYQIPESVLSGMVFLPILLAVLSLGLSYHFNRSLVFYYTVVVILCNVSLGLQLLETKQAYAGFSILIPVLIVAITLLPDRGIFSLRALPVHGLFIMSLLLLVVLEKAQPVFAEYYLLADWVPARYFDWTVQSQSVVVVTLASIIVLLVLYFMQPSSHRASALGVAILLIAQLHAGRDAASLNAFTNLALIICLYAITQESWRMAYLDELTELPTRRALKEKFQTLGGTYSVAMLDVDHFKKFNDTYGHDTGDAVLRMIANKLRKVPGGGKAYRYGGEEFSVVFNGKDKQQASPHLEQLRESIASTPFVINRADRRHKQNKNARKKQVTVTISIGVADTESATGKAKHTSTLNLKQVDPWDILKQADKALYRAKRKGRNCVVS